jgi:ABC-type transporter Mla subunit MlaD
MRFPVSELVTGLFVVIAIAVAVSLAIANSGDHGTPVECVADFEDVALLEEGNQVAVNGHPVGAVETIENVAIAGPDGVPELRVRVKFTIAAETMKVLRQGSYAQIDQASFLGSKFLKIVPNTSGDELPRVDGRVSFNTQLHFDMFATLAKFEKKIDDLIGPAKTLLENLNQKVVAFDMDGINQLVVDADTTMTKASVLLDDADEILKRTDESVNGAEGLIAELKKLTRDSDDLIKQLQNDLTEVKERGFKTLDGVDDLVGTSRDAIANLDRRLQEETLTEVKDTLDGAQDLMRSVDDKLATLTGATTTTLANADNLLTDQNLYGTMVEARNALRELKLLMLSLRANPAQVIFGGPGEIEGGASPTIRDRQQEFLSGRGRRYDAEK